MYPTESSGAIDYSSAKKLQGMSISSSTTPIMPHAGSSSAVEDKLMKTLKGISLSSSTTPAIPPAGSSSGIDNTFIKTLQDMSLSSSSTLATVPAESSSALLPGTEPSLMAIPSELRLKILSHALSGAAGSSGAINVNPRTKVTSEPSLEHVFREEEGQTKWQARRGLLQTCHTLREEALEVLYKENTLFAPMTQYSKSAYWYEKQRFSSWLESLGGDGEIQRVRKVTFGLQWSAHEEVGLGWAERVNKGDVRVSISKGKVTVGGSRIVANSPAAPLDKVDALIKKLMVGERLGYADWMTVWNKVEELMMSERGYPTPPQPDLFRTRC
ncbi:hypothetical protein Q7P35_009464 [Cladosporium inversicolor]